MMITAIASKGGKISPVYEESDSFTLVSGSGTDLEVKEMVVEQIHGQDLITARLRENGVQRVLAADIEEASIKSLESSGIQIFYGATGTISDGLNLISLGILDSMAGGCGGGCSSEGCGGCGSKDNQNSGCGSGCSCS